MKTTVQPDHQEWHGDLLDIVETLHANHEDPESSTEPIHVLSDKCQVEQRRIDIDKVKWHSLDDQMVFILGNLQRRASNLKNGSNHF